MTVTVTLDAATEEAIVRRASRLGLTPGDYLLRLAEKAVRPRRRAKRRRTLMQTNESPSLPPAQAVAFWREQGIIGSYGDPAIDAPDLALQLRRDAESRQWD